MPLVLLASIGYGSYFPPDGPCACLLDKQYKKNIIMVSLVIIEESENMQKSFLRLFNYVSMIIALQSKQAANIIFSHNH